VKGSRPIQKDQSVWGDEIDGIRKISSRDPLAHTTSGEDPREKAVTLLLEERSAFIAIRRLSYKLREKREEGGELGRRQGTTAKKIRQLEDPTHKAVPKKVINRVFRKKKYRRGQESDGTSSSRRKQSLT